MQSIKISTKTQDGRKDRVCVKIDTESLGLDWHKDDFIRTKFYKKDSKIVLQKVGNKYPKQVVSSLTNTAGGISKHQLGIYLTVTNRRFKDLTKSGCVTPAARLNGNTIEIHLPQEIMA